MKRFFAIVLLGLLLMGGLEAYAINTSEDIDKTILNLYNELCFNQKLADDEINILQDSRKDYRERIVKLQQEADKAALVLYSQDGESLFCVGLASEALSNVCNSFNKEKVPFENWLQAMTSLSNRYTNILKALKRIHTEHLDPKTLGYIQRSVAICDSMDARFSAIRDSIVLDRQRYAKLSAEMREFEKINQTVIERIRNKIFQNNEDFVSVLSSFNYTDLDIFYADNPERNPERIEYVMKTESLDKQFQRWDHYIFLIALALGVIMGLTLRFTLPKTSPYRSKRWYYAILLYIFASTVGTYIMSISIGLNDYMRHILDVCNDSNFFLFWMVLSATIRLKRPGIGWSVASYIPLYILDFILIGFATSLTRSQALKTTMPFMCIFTSVCALVILALGAKRFLKSDYPAVFGCTALILVSTVLTLMGYYYPSFILVLFSVSIMTYIAAFVCFKHYFADRIERSGKILRLTLSHLIYPLYFILAVILSLNESANVFNLRTWLSGLIEAPFINLPQFGIISASRLLLLTVIGIIVNYAIKLVKLILIRIDKEKYETGGQAVAITLCTMIAWFCFGILALVVLQINHSGVLAAIGGASLGIGFAMKETFENLISGLQLMASRARPGDLVECEGMRGVIRQIGILSTQIEIEDGPIASFPNRQLLCSSFTNLSLNHRREIRHIVFDISADSDLELARALMLEASRNIEGVVDHHKHYVVMSQTNSGLVRLDYKCWIDSALYLRAEPAVREAIFNAFRANGIKIADFSNEIGLHLTGALISK